MSPSLTGRRKRAFFAAIVSDPYRKLAAIALALGLWYFLNSQVSREVPISMALLVGQPNLGSTNQIGVLLGDETVVGTRFYDNEGNDLERVTLTVKGQSSEVDRVQETGLTLTVSFEDVLDWSKRSSVDFDAGDLRPSSQLRGLTVEMQPPVVRLDVQRLVDYPIPIQLEKVALQIDGDLGKRLRRNTAKFSPETAEIVGPANSIDAFRRQVDGGMLPFRAEITSKPTDRDVLATLEINAPASSGLRWKSRPTMLIRLDPQTTEFKLDLQIQIDDLALPPSLRTYEVLDGESHRIVSINAGGELQGRLIGLQSADGDAALAKWAWDHLRLLVFIPPPDPQITPLDQIQLVAELRLLGTLYSRVDGSHYSLAEPVPVTLVKK